MNTPVLKTLENNIFTITLNRPEKLNCINLDVLVQLNAALAEAETNSAIKIIILRGAGERAFSSGGDLKAFNALKPAEIATWIKLGNQVFNRLEALPKPTIAVIQGYAYGGGAELALTCDFRIATEQATFCWPELKHGWTPGWGALGRLKRLIGEVHAKALVFLTNTIDAQEAFRIGLVNQMVSPENLESALNQMTHNLLRLNPAVFELAKAALQDNSRTTSGSDLLYDVLATYYSKSTGSE